MEIKQIQLNNFKGFKEFKLDLKSKNIVISGINGCGKSSILEGVNLVLSKFASNYTPYKAISIPDESIRNGNSEAQLVLTLDHEGVPYSARLYKERSKRSKPKKAPKFNVSELKELTEHFANIIDGSIQEEPVAMNIPIFVYYPTDRNVIQVPVRIRQKHIFDQASAYDGAFNTGIDFKVFFEWYRNAEDIENEWIRKNHGYTDRTLETVRQAIYSFLPGFSELRIQRAQQKMVVKKGKTELSITQLSDGEKSLLALIGDLARRLAIANPASEDPTQGEGVILIDEIDLHLHPSLQRHVMKTLPVAFPNIQFIMTTHSPQVLGSSGEFDILFISEDENNVTVVDRLVDLYGRDSNLILEQFMGTSSRDQEVQVKLDRLFESIAKKEVEVSQELYRELETTLGPLEPQLKKAEFLIKRMKRG